MAGEPTPTCKDHSRLVCHNSTSTHVKTSKCIHARTRNWHFCILDSTYIDRNRKWLCSLLWRWLESIKDHQSLESMTGFGGIVLPRRWRATEPRRGERHSLWESRRTEARRRTWHARLRKWHRRSRKRWGTTRCRYEIVPQ